MPSPGRTSDSCRLLVSVEAAGLPQQTGRKAKPRADGDRAEGPATYPNAAWTCVGTSHLHHECRVSFDTPQFGVCGAHPQAGSRHGKLGLAVEAADPLRQQSGQHV